MHELVHVVIRKERLIKSNIFDKIKSEKDADKIKIYLDTLVAEVIGYYNYEAQKYYEYNKSDMLVDEYTYFYNKCKQNSIVFSRAKSKTFEEFVRECFGIEKILEPNETEELSDFVRFKESGDRNIVRRTYDKKYDKDINDFKEKLKASVEYINYSNPNGRIDWYILSGRWPKIIPTIYGFVDYSFIKDTTWKKSKKYFPNILVDVEFGWIESAETSEAMIFDILFDNLDEDDLIVAVDCHS